MWEKLLTPETFEFFARFLLAGYVVIFVRSAFVIGLRPKPTELLIEAIILSLVVQFVSVGVESAHQALVKFSTIALYSPEWLISPPDWLKLYAQVLLLAAILGAILGKFLQSDFRNGILRRFSLPVVHPVRRAHDFAFGLDRPAGYVEITFEDGTKIAGWFGENSLAATDDPRSDIYLERAYIIDNQGNWTDPGEPRAILVNLKNMRSVEFLLEKEKSDGK